MAASASAKSPRSLRLAIMSLIQPTLPAITATLLASHGLHLIPQLEPPMEQLRGSSSGLAVMEQWRPFGSQQMLAPPGRLSRGSLARIFPTRANSSRPRRRCISPIRMVSRPDAKMTSMNCFEGRTSFFVLPLPRWDGMLRLLSRPTLPPFSPSYLTCLCQPFFFAEKKTKKKQIMTCSDKRNRCRALRRNLGCCMALRPYEQHMDGHHPSLWQ